MQDRKNSRRSVVLLSGGIDSTTCVAMARAEGFECHALSFYYQQRHQIEKLLGAVERLPYERTCECASALKYALITRPDAIPARTREELAPIVGKYLAPV